MTRNTIRQVTGTRVRIGDGVVASPSSIEVLSVDSCQMIHRVSAGWHFGPKVQRSMTMKLVWNNDPYPKDGYESRDIET